MPVAVSVCVCVCGCVCACQIVFMYHWPLSVVINMNSLQMCCLLKGAAGCRTCDLFAREMQKYWLNKWENVIENMHYPPTHYSLLPVEYAALADTFKQIPMQDKWYLSHFIAPGCVHASLDMPVFMYNALTNANSPCTMIIFSSKYHKSTTATTTTTGKVNGQQIFIAFDAERRARHACNIYCNSHAANEGIVA